MGTTMFRKYLLALLFAFVTASVVTAASTKFTNVEVTGSLTVDGATTHVGAVTTTGSSTSSGSLTRTGTTTLSTTTYTGAFLPWPRTLAQINALTSGTTGQVVVCSDCTMTKICVSSGTVNPGAWTVTQATATALTPLHCQ